MHGIALEMCTQTRNDICPLKPVNSDGNLVRSFRFGDGCSWSILATVGYVIPSGEVQLGIRLCFGMLGFDQSLKNY